MRVCQFSLESSNQFIAFVLLITIRAETTVRNRHRRRCYQVADFLSDTAPERLSFGSKEWGSWMEPFVREKMLRTV